jgi:hypothetical protein
MLGNGEKERLPATMWAQRDSWILRLLKLPPFCRQKPWERPAGTGIERDGQPGLKYEMARVGTSRDRSEWPEPN